jgi:hypothetical protein
MPPRIYHGNIQIDDFLTSLQAYFNQGQYQVKAVGDEKFVVVQIGTRPNATAGGATSITISLQKVEDGVSVEVGQQAMLGIAASFGRTALEALIRPANLLGRIDDLAQDFTSVQLSDEVTRVLDSTAKSLNASFDLSERLKKYVCSYCQTPNPIGESHCIACGAPLGDIQPRTCPHCGYVVTSSEAICPNCGKPISSVK